MRLIWPMMRLGHILKFSLERHLYHIARYLVSIAAPSVASPALNPSCHPIGPHMHIISQCMCRCQRASMGASENSARSLTGGESAASCVDTLARTV